MDREAWRAAVHGVARTEWLSDWTDEFIISIYNIFLCFNQMGKWINLISNPKKVILARKIYWGEQMESTTPEEDEINFIHHPYVHAWVLSHVRLFVTPWTVIHQAPLSMGFSRQEYWSELPFPSPGDLPDTGIKFTSPVSPALQVDSLPLEPSGKPIHHPYHASQSWIAWSSKRH